MPDSRKSGLYHPWDLFILLVSIYVLVGMAMGRFLSDSSEMRLLLERLDMVVCLIFLVDFARHLKQAPNKKKYFLSWGWIDLVSSIPAVDLLRWGRLARVFRILRLLRAVKSGHELYGYLLKQREKSALLAAMGLVLFTVFIGAILVLEFEGGASSGIDSAEKALWWAVVTMTTVGYGDVVPVTTEGRVLAGFMMVMGLCLLAILTGAFASWFTRQDRENRNEELAAIRRDLALIKKKLEIEEENPPRHWD